MSYFCYSPYYDSVPSVAFCLVASHQYVTGERQRINTCTASLSWMPSLR